MKLFLIPVLFLVSCSAPVVNWKTANIPNGCVVNAEGYKAAYTSAHSQSPWFWARVLMIKLKEPDGIGPNAHALAVIQWPDGVWGYDQTFGARKLTSLTDLKHKPATMARLWLASNDFMEAFYLTDAP